MNIYVHFEVRRWTKLKFFSNLILFLNRSPYIPKVTLPIFKQFSCLLSIFARKWCEHFNCWNFSINTLLEIFINRNVNYLRLSSGSFVSAYIAILLSSSRVLLLNWHRNSLERENPNVLLFTMTTFLAWFRECKLLDVSLDLCETFTERFNVANCMLLLLFWMCHAYFFSFCCTKQIQILLHSFLLFGFALNEFVGSWLFLEIFHLTWICLFLRFFFCCVWTYTFFGMK